MSFEKNYNSKCTSNLTLERPSGSIDTLRFLLFTISQFTVTIHLMWKLLAMTF